MHRIHQVPEMSGYTQVAPPLSVMPAMFGPPPYGIWPVSFTPDAVEEARKKNLTYIGQAAAPAPRQSDLFGTVVGLGALVGGIYAALQPGPKTVKRYVAPAAAALAGITLFVKST